VDDLFNKVMNINDEIQKQIEDDFESKNLESIEKTKYNSDKIENESKKEIWFTLLNKEFV